MAIAEDRWFEVWYEEAYRSVPGYFLIVGYDASSSPHIYIKELSNGRIIFKATDYDEIYNWLREDDFYQGNGREFEELPEPSSNRFATNMDRVS